VDVILLDTTFWAAYAHASKLQVCETFQLGIAVHSSGELGIQLATMLYMEQFFQVFVAGDAHYHQLTTANLV
jgi:glucarate dehydratase